MMKKKKNKLALPLEIEENILSRLPVKTILRFMSVCKLWYSLFRDPYFINIHYENNSGTLLLMRLGKTKDIVVMDSSSSVVRSSLFTNPNLDGLRNYETSVVGAFNGIVCVHGIARCWNHGRFPEYFRLWNPALKIVKNIMSRFSYLKAKDLECVFVGFGFHKNDYKVLRFQKSIASQVEIYSLSSDSWRTVNVAPSYCVGHSHACASVGVYVNGAHHWGFIYKTEFKYSSTIISFDMVEEMFKDIPIPAECMGTGTHLTLFNYNESLSIVVDYMGMRDFPCIWVMKDYGLHDSWTKLCKIDIRRAILVFRGFISWPHNELIFSRYMLTGGQDSIGFDIDKLEVKDIIKSITNVEALKDATQVMTYSESLLLLNSTNLIHHDQV